MCSCFDLLFCILSSTLLFLINLDRMFRWMLAFLMLVYFSSTTLSNIVACAFFAADYT